MRNATVLRIPADPAALPAWLDRELVGPDLADLVVELEVIRGEEDVIPGRSLDATLGDLLPAVLRDGLSTLPRPALQGLLRHPRLLLDLQERILLEGGPRWDRLANEAPRPSEEVDEAWRGIAARIGFDEEAPGRKGSPTTIPIAAAARFPTFRIRFLEAWAGLATVAASILAILYVADREPPRGLLRPELITPASSPKAKFLAIATAAKEWPDGPISTRDGLARRLGDLRTGCTRIIVADHSDLSPEDRAWLVDHCRTWAGKLDVAIRDLEGGAPLDRVRAEAGATVDHAVELLRARAARRS